MPCETRHRRAIRTRRVRFRLYSYFLLSFDLSQCLLRPRAKAVSNSRCRSSPLVGSPELPQISGIRKPRKSCALKKVSTTLPLDYCYSPTDVGTTDDGILLEPAHVLLAFSSWTNKDYRGHIEI